MTTDFPATNPPQFGPSFVKYVDEATTRMQRIAEKLEARYADEPRTVTMTKKMFAPSGIIVPFPPSSIGTAQEVVVVPQGFVFKLHRFGLNLDGFNYGNPYGNAVGSWEISIDTGSGLNGPYSTGMIDGDSLLVASALPTVKTWGTHDAPELEGYCALKLRMNPLPANAVITATIQGTWARTKRTDYVL